MRALRFLALAAAASLVVPVPAIAQAVSPSPAVSAPAMTMPKPAATPKQVSTKPSDVKALRFFLGTWQCKITASSGKAAGRIGDASTIRFAPMFDGTWIVGTAYRTDPKTKKTVAIGQLLQSYDAFAKRWTAVNVGSGGSYDLFFANSFAATTVFKESADVAGGLSTSTVTVKELSPTKWQWTYEGPIDQQNTAGSNTTACTKT
jgi:hypothetical protein